MTEFKVGDRVRLTGDEWSTHRDWLDIEGEFVVSFSEDATVGFESHGQKWWIGGEGYEAELVEVAPSAVEPTHYTHGNFETIDLIEHLPFNRGSAVKYLSRAGRKDDELTDLKKAAWFVAREIARVEKENKQ